MKQWISGCLVWVGQRGGVCQVWPCLSFTFQHWRLLDLPRLPDHPPPDRVGQLDHHEAAHRSQPRPGRRVTTSSILFATVTKTCGTCKRFVSSPFHTASCFCSWQYFAASFSPRPKRKFRRAWWTTSACSSLCAAGASARPSLPSSRRRHQRKPTRILADAAAHAHINTHPVALTKAKKKKKQTKKKPHTGQFFFFFLFYSRHFRSVRPLRDSFFLMSCALMIKDASAVACLWFDLWLLLFSILVLANVQFYPVRNSLECRRSSAGTRVVMRSNTHTVTGCWVVLLEIFTIIFNVIAKRWT